MRTGTNNSVQERRNGYTPFGSVLSGRSWSEPSLTAKYKYGFNGKEKVDEISGEGNDMDFGARIYDSRLARFFSTDPLQCKQPFISPYSYAWNQPIWAIDANGMIRIVLIEEYTRADGTVLTINHGEIYNSQTAEEVDGSHFTDVQVKIHTKSLFYHPASGSNFTYAATIHYGVTEIKGGLTPREEVYDNNFAGGLFYDFNRILNPMAKLAEVLTKTDAASGAPLSGMQMGARVLSALGDIVTLGTSKAETFLFNYIEGKFTDMAEDKLIELGCASVGQEKMAGLVKFMASMYKVGLKIKVDEKTTVATAEFLKAFLTGAKSSAELTDYIDKTFGQGFNVDYATVQEAIEKQVDKYDYETEADYSKLDDGTYETKKQQ